MTLPCYSWTHSVVVPPDHPLLDGEPLTLARLARFPMVTYDEGFTGRSHIDEAFAKAALKPSIVLSAMDADVIKTYVELGMGVGVVASIAFDPDRDRNLRAIDAGHLFAINMTRLAFRRGAYLRGYAYGFMETFAPPLTREGGGAGRAAVHRGRGRLKSGLRRVRAGSAACGPCRACPGRHDR